MKTFFLFSAILFLISFRVSAFPELTRHGYTNCVSCHVSPTGGGLMSLYGRSLSRELLSTWGYENEERLGHGALPEPPSWLNIGGDIRYLQAYTNNDSVQAASFFPMQRDIESAVTLGKLVFDYTVGLQGGPAGTPNLNQVLSRRYYLMYHITDIDSIRLGRFYPRYGIMGPNHRNLVRKDLGFDQGQERYNIEYAHLGETFDWYITYLTGKKLIDGYPIASYDSPWRDEVGWALSSSVAVTDRSKVGVNFLTGQTPAVTRNLYGVFGIIGFTPSWYLLSEFDLQFSNLTTVPGSPPKSGAFTFNQLGYEVFKGFVTYLVHQYEKSDASDGGSQIDSFALGINFFPRPHFEFGAEYKKEETLSVSSGYYDLGFILLHYYL